MRIRKRASTTSSADNFYDHVDGFNASTMVVPSKGPAYILLKDTVGLKRAKRRIGVRFGSQTIFTAHAGAIYLGNKDDKQPQDKTMISLVSLTDSKRILVTPKENTRQLSTAELKMMLPITSDQRRAKILSSTVFMEAITAQINDIVTITDGELQAVATIKYVGQLPWKQHGGVYLGVEFEEPIGDSDGCDMFETEEDRGKFITVDKIDKFIVKNEKTRYALSNNVIDKSQQSGGGDDHIKKINKRLSFPIMSTLARIKPKMKSSASLQDLSIGITKKEISSSTNLPDADPDDIDNNKDPHLSVGDDSTDSVDAVCIRYRKDSDNSSKKSSATDNISTDEPIYAISDITIGHQHHAGNEKGGVGEESELSEKQKKAQKRMSFPLSLSALVPNFSTMTLPKMRSRSKSLESIHQMDVENPYYATSADMMGGAAPVLADGKKSPRLSEIVERDESEPTTMLCFNQGCDVKVSKDMLEKHQEACKFALKKCPNEGCGLSMRRADINKHDFVDCEYALVKCKAPGCNAHMCRKMTSQHALVCRRSEEKSTASVTQQQQQHDTYEMMSLGDLTVASSDDDFIYASSHSLKCPAPRCCFQGDESNLCDHLCSQHSDLILKHLTELKTIFSNKEAEKDLSHLYTKPVKKVAPTPRPRKPSSDDNSAPVYSTPSNNNNNDKVISKNIPKNDSNSGKANTVDYSQKELPVYTTPSQQSTRKTVQDNEYLTPVDCKEVTDHIYLTPVDKKEMAYPDSNKSQNQAQYEYVAFQVKT